MTDTPILDGGSNPESVIPSGKEVTAKSTFTTHSVSLDEYNNWR